MPTSVSIPSSLDRIHKHWSPALIATLNGDVELKVVKVKGSFVWHSHADTDEIFYILGTSSGDPDDGLIIQFDEADGGDRLLKTGDMLTIPRGVRHCPKTSKPDLEVRCMLIEKVGTINTGERTDRCVCLLELDLQR